MVYKLTPAFKDYIWGGTALKNKYGKKADMDIIAEAWELSCHKNGESCLPDGTALSQFLSQNIGAAGTKCDKFEQFPLLVKLIDAAKDLSVQVHPSDDFALEHEQQLGKTEMWYVLSAEAGASLYCGFKKTVSKEEYASAINDGTLCELLNKVNVKKGDMFFINAGTIHAIGAGIVIAEIQQSSDVTYRVYDYNRKDASMAQRELHVDKALQVTNLSANDKQKSFGEHLARCDYFTVDLLQFDEKCVIIADETSFKAVLLISGNAKITNENAVDAAAGETMLIPAGSGKITIEGNGEALIIYVG